MSPLHRKNILLGFVIPLIFLFFLASLACDLPGKPVDPNSTPQPAGDPQIVKVYSGSAKFVQFFFGGETTCENQHTATLTLYSDGSAVLNTLGRGFTYGSGTCNEDDVDLAYNIIGIWLSAESDSYEIAFKSCNDGVMTAIGDAKVQASLANQAVGSATCTWPDGEIDSSFDFTLSETP